MSISLATLLGAGWSQTDRLLELHTPLGPEALLAERVLIEEALGPVPQHAGYRIELGVIAADARLPLNALLGQAVRLDLQTALSRTQKRVFHGHVTAIRNDGSDGGFARYTLTIEPWLAFLGKNRDSYVFQDKTLIEILDEIFNDWVGQGKLLPAWRWSLSDPGSYPKRSLTVQYGESDLAFVRRLLAEHGVFCRFEHTAEADDSLGCHTLVLADDSTAMADAPHAVRYTQAGATLSEDSLDTWQQRTDIGYSDTQTQSWDYRSRVNRLVSQPGRSTSDAIRSTEDWFDAGPYAWPTRDWAEEITRRHREALDTCLETFHGEGSLRTAAPGQRIDLREHPRIDRLPAEDRIYLVTRVTHEARNNLPSVLVGDANPVDFYRCELGAQRAKFPWRPFIRGNDPYPRPQVPASQTAMVVGNGEPTHTDRDLRVKILFPWQRGSHSAARQSHPSGADNAPADERLGVWVRVAQPIAGNNWGAHFTPRPGQEVRITFLNGNIDRPVVNGALYNGRGQTDAAGNRIGGPTMNASANAPAFFAGEAGEHAHGGALSGIKTQAIAHSQDGRGGHNQLIFDDSPSQGRSELATTQHHSRLSLGHLKQQSGNARQADRGHGAELATDASIALRAGHGLLISADARSNAQGPHLDSRESLQQTRQAGEQTRALAELAQKQNAGLPGETPGQPLPAEQGWQHAVDVLGATTRQNGETQAGAGPIKAIRGGQGSVPAWSEARLQLSAPAGIAQVTPKNHVLVAGATLSLNSRDHNLAAQGNYRLKLKGGLSLFAAGQAPAAGSPMTDTGIHLHAAQGKVSLQSQSGATEAAADKTVTLASTEGSIEASAKEHLMATAQGAYIKLEGGNIEIHAPGKVEFKASFKKLTGPKLAQAEAVALPQASAIKGCATAVQQAAAQQLPFSEF